MRKTVLELVDALLTSFLHLNPRSFRRGFCRILLITRQTNDLRWFASMLLFVFAALVTTHVTLALGARWDLEPFDSLWRKGTWRLDVDNSVSEYVEYSLLLFAAFAVLGCWVRTKTPVYLALAIVNLFLLADGYLQIHEFSGRFAAVGWQGELIYFSVVSLALTFLAVTSFHRSALCERVGAALGVVTLSAAAACGVVIDAVHSIVKYHAHRDYLREALALVEDGGELLFLMLNAILMAAVYRRITLEQREQKLNIG